MDEQTLTKAVTIREFIHKPKIASQIGAVLPEFMKADRFLKVFYSSLMVQPKLLDCTQASLLSSMIQSGQLGLEPILGKAAIIPYNNKRGNEWFLEAQFQPMYRGLCDLARRSQRTIISGHVVYETDKFEILYGTEEKIIFVPDFMAEALSDRGRKLGAFTVWKFPDEDQTTIKFMPWADIMDVRDKYSKAWKKKGKDSPWGMREDEMAVKTVVKNHAKLQPCSIELDFAVNMDNKLDAGASTVGQFAPTDKLPEIQERYDETVHDLEKVPAGDMTFVDPKTGEVIEEGTKVEKKPLAEIFSEEIIGPSGLTADEVMAFVKANAQNDRVTEHEYMEKLLEYKPDAIMALKRWKKAQVKKTTKPEETGKKQEKPATTGRPATDAPTDPFQLYKTKRFSKDPKEGLLGWINYDYGLKKIAAWSVADRAKLKSTLLKRGYGPEQVPALLNEEARAPAPVEEPPVEEPPVEDPPVEDPPVEVEAGPTPKPMGNDDVTRSMKAKVEERIAATETDLDLNFRGFVQVLNDGLDPDGYTDVFEYMRAILDGREKFDDLWHQYEKSLVAGGPVG